MKRRGILSAIAILALLLETCTSPSDTQRLPPIKNKIAVIAHRGASALAPENTLAGVRKAIAIGADFVEVDVRETRDGHLICMHDSTLDRTTDGQGRVEDRTLEYIRGLDAGSWFSDRFAGDRVPTFDEVLEVSRGKINIYLDHKAGSAKAILTTLEKREMTQSVIVYNSVDELKKWKQLAPEIPIMPSLPRAFRRPGGVAAFLKILPAEVLDGGISDWTKELVDQAHQNGVQVQVDCLGIHDSADGYRKALEYGVDGIQSDHPDEVVRIVNSWDPKSNL